MEINENITLKFNNDNLLPNSVNIEDDIWTCSSKMRYDIYYFFKDKPHLKIAEIGSHKGYSTKILSKIFSKVYAVDNNNEFTNFNKNFNKESTNIDYIMLDIYKDSWQTLPDDIEVSFIDADHTYNGCKSDIFNSIKQFKKLKYIIFDDYGVWSGVKQIINELIDKKILIFEKFIGINDVPGPSGIVKNTNEGIICSVNHSIINNNNNNNNNDENENNNNPLLYNQTILTNKTYTWENSSITFLHDFQMNAFGKGYYQFINKHTIIALFGNRQHTIHFNDDYTSFDSIRKDDSHHVNGSLVNNSTYNNDDNRNITTYNTKYGLVTLYNNDCYIAREFKINKYWDEDTLLKLRDYINPNRNILEIGGHCGTSTIVYSSFLNDNQKIFVYEPQHNIYNLLVKNINQNNLQHKIIPNNLGVFCYEGIAQMNQIDIDGGNGVVLKRFNEEKHLDCNFGGIGLGDGGEEINLITIDKMGLEDIGFIHCDAQGAENFIFSKGLETIKKNRPVIYYEDNENYGLYLYSNVCKTYPNYVEESKFNIVKYCIEQLNYSKFITRFNGGIDTLLIP